MTTGIWFVFVALCASSVYLGYSMHLLRKTVLEAEGRYLKLETIKADAALNSFEMQEANRKVDETNARLRWEAICVRLEQIESATGRRDL